MIAVLLGLDLKQFDFSSAFLCATLNKPVMANPPPGYIIREDECLLILRALYGMCNSSREWYLLVSSEFKKLGFKSSRMDQCLFYRRIDQSIQIIGLHVDDGLVAGPVDLNNRLINMLKIKYKLKSESIRWYLGMFVQWNEDKSAISLTMEAYIVKLATKFRVLDSKPVSTPLEAGIILSKNKGERTTAPYLELIGALIYLMCAVRPDIAYAVSRLSKYMSNPSKLHWQCAKRVLKYVHHTRKLGIVYKRDSKVNKLQDLRISGYSDSDGHGDVDTRRSTTGYNVNIGNNILYYKSQTQSISVDNMCESEYIAGCSCVHEMVYYDNVLQLMTEDLKIKRSKIPMDLYVDNNAAIKISGKYELSGKSKHIEKKFWHLKDKVHYGDIKVHHIESENNSADLMTKAPLVKDYLRLRPKLVSTLPK
mmetsp:Transcript_7125/g.10857  ORF Transcript_7125/g.10857 Transcript_7125/m.10857 type:complete len:422 (-) Transcript_7125:88-1353(-)